MSKNPAPARPAKRSRPKWPSRCRRAAQERAQRQLQRYCPEV